MKEAWPVPERGRAVNGGMLGFADGAGGGGCPALRSKELSQHAKTWGRCQRSHGVGAARLKRQPTVIRFQRYGALEKSKLRRR